MEKGRVNPAQMFLWHSDLPFAPRMHTKTAEKSASKVGSN